MSLGFPAVGVHDRLANRSSRPAPMHGCPDRESGRLVAYEPNRDTGGLVRLAPEPRTTEDATRLSERKNRTDNHRKWKDTKRDEPEDAMTASVGVDRVDALVRERLPDERDVHEQEHEGGQSEQDGSGGPPLRARTSPTARRIGNTTQEGVTPSTIHEVTAKARPRSASATSSPFQAST